jgi:hypothetical protein
LQFYACKKYCALLDTFKYQLKKIPPERQFLTGAHFLAYVCELTYLAKQAQSQFNLRKSVPSRSLGIGRSKVPCAAEHATGPWQRDGFAQIIIKKITIYDLRFSCRNFGITIK